jgi:hypothetical protein
MDRLIYCSKQDKWIWPQECEAPCCDHACEANQPAEPFFGDGDCYFHEELENDPADAQAASVTVYIPESDQFCHFGPDWASMDDDTMSFVELSLDEIYGWDDDSQSDMTDTKSNDPGDGDEMDGGDFENTFDDADADGEWESGENDWGEWDTNWSNE